MRKTLVWFIAAWLAVWVFVGLYLFYFMERASARSSPAAASVAKEKSYLKATHNEHIQERRDRPHPYPLCRDITHLPTSLKPFDCAFNLMQDTDYLPDYDLIQHLKRNARHTTGYQDREMYIQRVYALQNPANCSKQKWHVVKFTSHGHGVNLFHLAVNIGDHYDRNIPVVASNSAYRFGSHGEICTGKTRVNRGWSCHMSPLSQTCQVLEGEGDADNVVNWSHLDAEHVQRDWCKPNGRFSPQYGRCKCDLGFMPNESGSSCVSYELDRTFRDKNKWKNRYARYHALEDDYAMEGTEHWVSRMTPGEIFAAQNTRDPATWPYDKFTWRFPDQAASFSRLKLKYGFFWWILQNSWLLHKDAPRRAEMESKARALLFPKSRESQQQQCIAVQVRRGDSCRDATAPHRTCPKLQVYIERVRRMKQMYKITGPITIYLASDDPSAIAEAEQLTKTEEDFWVWQPITRERYVNGHAVDNNEALFQDEAMDELYFDLWAISLCEVGFVTSFASSVAWNAYALAVGRFGYYIPFLSVDLPWGHKILGEHHARGNLFDGTVDAHELERDRSALLAQ